MKIPKKEVDPDNWNEAVNALATGKMTRAQAAEHAGLHYQTFISHMRRAGLQKALKPVAVNANAGANNPNARSDPDRYERYQQALAAALAAGSVAQAARQYNVNYQVLARKVREAKTPTRG